MPLGVLWPCSHDCTVFAVTPKNRAKMLWLAPNSLRTFLTEAASYCMGWKSKTIVSRVNFFADDFLSLNEADNSRRPPIISSPTRLIEHPLDEGTVAVEGREFHARYPEFVLNDNVRRRQFSGRVLRHRRMLQPWRRRHGWPFTFRRPADAGPASRKVRAMSYRDYAQTVRTMISFEPVRELFVSHVERWRRKMKVIDAHRNRIHQSVSFLKDLKWTFKFTAWVQHDAGSNRCFVPKELEQRYERLGHRLRSLRLNNEDRIRERTPSEQFTTLAAVHDGFAGSNDPRLGPSELGECRRGEAHYAIEVWAIGETPDQEKTLRELLAAVLARIEQRIDPKTTNRNGELLVDVIARIRSDWGLQSSKTVAIQARIKSELESERSAGAKGMSWCDVLPAAESYVQRRGYHGLKALARELKCHHRTLRKAIDNSDRLRTAEQKYLDGKNAAIPKRRQQRINAVVADKLAAKTDGTESIATDDIFQRAIDAAETDEKRETLLKMSQADRRELVALVSDDPDAEFKFAKPKRAPGRAQVKHRKPR